MRTRSLKLVTGCFALYCSIPIGCASNSPSQTGDDGNASSSGGAVAAGGAANATGGSKSSSKVQSDDNARGGASGGSEGKGTGGKKASTDANSGSDAAGGAVPVTSGRGGVGTTGGSTSKGGGGTTVPKGGSSGKGGGGTGGKGTVSSEVSKGGSTIKSGTAAGGHSATGGSTQGVGGVNAGGQSSSSGTEPPGKATKSAGCGKTPTLKNGKGLSLAVGSSNRTYNLKIPDNYDNNNPYRLILAYHPLNGTANQVSDGGMGMPGNYYGLWDLAGGTTIFASPQGLNNAWNNTSGADVEFSRQLIATLENGLCIDTSRIFCEGFSMGGSMSYAMACAMGDVVRAIAVHSGGPMSGCVKHDKPVAYFMTHGTNDSVCTYPKYGVPELNDFAKVNGCTAQSMPTPTDSSGKTPACVDFADCDAGYPARACIFVGDHTPSPGGTSSSWVPKETWKFLSQF